MADQEDLINQFVDITGVTTDRAKFYLEAANFTLEVALSSFYEEEHDMEPEAPVPDDDVTPDAESEPEPRSQTPKLKKSKPKSNDRFATLQSLKNNDSSSDSDEEQGQAFYAGGSERSGQQVLGPPKKKPVNDYVSEVFRSAQQGGIESFDPENRGQGSGSSGRMYGGTGYRLGQTDTDHVVIPTPSSSSSRASFPSVEQEVVNLRLWREGFSINDGDLRRYSDPQNREFFECIKRGEIPTELQKKSSGVIHVNLEDHRHEDFVRMVSKFKTFQGEGHTLGSPVPNVVFAEPATAPHAIPNSSSGNSNAENEQLALAELHVNSDQPTTMLQIRLSDGSRLSTRFNLTHTIDNIRQYINLARPQYSNQNFMLLTTFPSKELSDGTQTIEAAGLANAAILQRMK